MGRKRLYHTDEEKAEAKRRNRMDWYDRNWTKVLKAYSIKKSKESVSSSTKRTSSLGLNNTALPKDISASSSSRSKIAPTEDTGGIKKKSDNTDGAPQILLGRVHKQSRLLRDFMLSDAEDFCQRVAQEVIVAAKDRQLIVVQTYMDSVAAFIDGARPHTVTLFNTHGAISEWKEAKQIQNNMGLVMQYLDEIYRHVGLEDLAAAVGLNLLSFQ